MESKLNEFKSKLEKQVNELKETQNSMEDTLLEGLQAKFKANEAEVLSEVDIKVQATTNTILKSMQA